MINKYHLSSFKAFRKKQQNKREIEQNKEENQPKRFFIHNFESPKVNPLKMRLSHRQLSHSQQKIPKSFRNSSRAQASQTERRVRVSFNHSLSRQKNKTSNKSQINHQLNTISDKQLKKMKQIIYRLQKNKKTTQTIENVHQPLKIEKKRLKTISYQNGFNFLSVVRQSKSTKQKKSVLKNLPKMDIGSLKPNKPPMNIIRNQTPKNQKKAKQNQEMHRIFRQSLSAWATHEDLQF